mmetsp:Transcript_488/g.475  ORF Transcript_488/g.475 Transcript_488/m.475 type:complete len:91 (+) Transcript_488:200-472(+)
MAKQKVNGKLTPNNASGSVKRMTAIIISNMQPVIVTYPRLACFEFLVIQQSKTLATSRVTAEKKTSIYTTIVNGRLKLHILNSGVSSSTK